MSVEDKQVEREIGVLAGLQFVALACTATPDGFRDAMVRRLVRGLINVFIPDSSRDVSTIEYQPEATGIVVKDVKPSGATMVIGDEELWRVALGGFVRIGEELRGAASQLAAVQFAANRPAIIWIGGERVRVKSAAEAKDAARIMTLLDDTYGVVFDSIAVRRAVRKDKAERGRSVDDVRAYDVEPWTYLDLKDLELGLKYYAPILGKARSKSSRASTPQEVVRLGRLRSPRTAEAEYLQEMRAVATYQSHPDYMPDSDEATVVHEIAHAVFGPLVEDFRTKIGYWTHRGDHRFEAPPTPYGNKDPHEDLAESVALYFTAPDVLLNGQRGKKRGEVGNPCPKRHRWIKAEVARWKPVRR